MLDEVAVVSDHARHEDLSGRELDVLPHPPLVLVTGVRGLDRISVGPHLQNQVHDIAKRDIVPVRTMIAAPAHVEAHAAG